MSKTKPTGRHVSVDDLSDARAELEAAIRKFSVDGDHLIADLALLGFAREVLESLIAVSLLSQSDVPRMLYGSARSAFEAVSEMIALISEGDYDSQGAKARVSELFERDASRDAALAVAREITPVEEDLEPVERIEENLETDKRFWDQCASEARSHVLDRAYEEVKAAREKRNWTWFGTSRTKLLERAGDYIGGGEVTTALMRSWYSLLSIQSHPAPRINTKHLRLTNGKFVFGTPDEERSNVIGHGVGAVFVSTKVAVAILTKVQTDRKESTTGVSVSRT